MRSWHLATIGAILLLVLGLLAVSARPGGPDGSTLARGAKGWAGAWALLEGEGVEIRRHSRPVGEDVPPDALLVSVFPFQRRPAPETAAAWAHHLRLGGRLLIGYTGSLGGVEEDLLGSLGVVLRYPQSIGFISPWRFYKERRGATTLEPTDLLPAARALEMALPVRIADPPSGSRVWFADERGDPVVFSFESQRQGEVWVVPAEVFSNARLGRPGNADLLLSLASSLDRAWIFDEYAHGLSTAEATPAVVGGLNLFFAHLAVVYLLAVWGLCKRRGSAWPPMRPQIGGHARFLLGLGALHDRLGHHQAAAKHLVERWQRLTQRQPGEEVRIQLQQAVSRQDFLQLSQRLSTTGGHGDEVRSRE